MWAALNMVIESTENLYYTTISVKAEILKNYQVEKRYFNEKIISYIFIKSPHKELTAIHLERLRGEIKKLS